jgi:hypothetical protein
MTGQIAGMIKDIKPVDIIINDMIDQALGVMKAMAKQFGGV